MRSKERQQPQDEVSVPRSQKDLRRVGISNDEIDQLQADAGEHGELHPADFDVAPDIALELGEEELLEVFGTAIVGAGKEWKEENC